MNISPGTLELLNDTVTSCARIDCAALYGSVARGDAESYSDIDILAVCEKDSKPLVYDELSQKLSSRFKRLSLSIYSPQELSFLSKRGSLFLLHLRREAVPLVDRSGFLGEVLSRFEAKPSYDEDFAKSLELAIPLRTAVLKAPNHLHRLAHVYSLFRIYGVYLLARAEIFEFSKAKMAARLAHMLPSRANEIKRLSRLRILNTSFFTGQNDLNEPTTIRGGLPLFRRCAADLGRLVDHEIEVNEVSYPEAVGEFLNACTGRPSLLGYHLRSWFLLLVYDGLNLYSMNNGWPEIRSFRENDLIRFANQREPKPIKAAADQSLSYIRNYHLKYIFAEDRRISAEKACRVLTDLIAVTGSSHTDTSDQM